MQDTSNNTKKISYKGHRGGYRANAGRKPKVALRKQFKAREELYAWIDKNWMALMNGLEICLQSKDKEMIKYLIDQRIGRAPQRVEMTGEEGDILKIQVIPYGKDNPTP